MGTYAGGKATNVARVMDALAHPDDSLEIELIVFRPDSLEGRYIAELQSTELTRVRVRSIIVDSTARFCINVSDPSSLSSNALVEFNISPRVVWQPAARQTALEVAAGLDTDLLLLAGNPPLAASDVGQASSLSSSSAPTSHPDIAPHIAPQHHRRTDSTVMIDLPASIIAAAPGPPRLTVDIGGPALARILQGPRHPDVIKINNDEYASVDQTTWGNYSGVLVVTDAAGCTVWAKGPSGSGVRVPAVTGHKVYSTVGAGDAAHAAFTLAAWVWDYDPVRAAGYSMAAAAAAVSSPAGTRGITREAVARFLQEMEHTALS
jgi:fructose-1-phosphate kinase PfkB-like protein